MLKPCPFCGGTPIDEEILIECPECSADISGNGGRITGSEDRVERWNRRTPGPATAKMIDELRTRGCAWLSGNTIRAFIAEWESYE